MNQDLNELTERIKRLIRIGEKDTPQSNMFQTGFNTGVRFAVKEVERYAREQAENRV